MFQKIISQLFILISFSIGTGMLLHETKIDKLTTLAVAHPVVVAKKVSSGKLLESMPHTHLEAGLFESSSRELRVQNHGMAPRRDRDEKYRMQKNVPKGYHLFDSYYLPLEAFAR